MIFKVTGVKVPKSPSVALLNFHIPKISKFTQKLIFFIFLGVKLTIAKSWKLPTVSFRAVKHKMSWIMSQEKMVSFLLDASQQFEETWEPWATYLDVR